jgi:hypothetical protein
MFALVPVVRAADNAPFDLAGPKIDVRVTRGAVTLPIAEVPNLQPGDKLWIKADFPPTQSNHLIVVVAFLRGTTNQPPDNWFTEIDTWDKKTLEGTTITVPVDAQQALLFVAPETGGDFKTLRSAVKGKPGLFIRANADLNEASFEQQRIERYLAAMKSMPPNDPKAIQEHSAKLAATLALKPDDKCFKLPVDQQVACLTQSKPPMLMEDGHGQGVAEALSTGASSDFINAASTTQMAGAGLYSAYVGTVVDLVHLVGTLRTAQYQYIPAISFPQEATLNLKLNAPPSFHNPKSVIVIGLPAIQTAKLPPLKQPDAQQVACLLQPKMTLPLQGAPLVFSTSFAHQLTLHINSKDGAQDIPLTADAFEGGLVAAKPGKPSGDDLTVTGTVHGYWGFDHFDGPTLKLQQIPGKGWKFVGNTQLLAGQDNKLTLQGEGTACVQKMELTNNKPDAKTDVKTDAKPDGKDKTPTVAVTFRPVKDQLALDVPLKTAQPGGYSLSIQQYGTAKPDDVPLTAYSNDVHLTEVQIHAGDNTAVLTGQDLKNVASVQIGDQAFSPANASADAKTLHLHAAAAAKVAAGAQADVKLKDGRSLKVKITAQAARPTVKLLSMQATAVDSQGALAVTLGAKNDIPLAGKLTFVVQSSQDFPRAQSIEVATDGEAVHTTLSLAAGSLVLQDAHTAVATLDPLKAFGQSAFGKLSFRPVAADGTTGEWIGLGTLVRTPQVTAIHCTTPAAPCTAEGKNLFLAQAFSASKDFTGARPVPTGFAQDSLEVPAPTDGSTLYLKLRDDPSGIASVKLPAPLAAAAPATPPASAPATTANKPPAARPTPAAQSTPAATPAPAAAAAATPAVAPQ